MRVLVTGGGGFLGGKIAVKLCSRGDDVTVFGHIRTDSGSNRDIYNNINWVAGDIRNGELIRKVILEQKIESVVHAAAFVGITQTLTAPIDLVEVNILGSLKLLAALKGSNVIRYVEISSADVYGEFKKEMLNEDTIPQPITPYGISKFASEAFLKFFSYYNNFDARIARTSWVYGPGLKRNRIPRNIIKSALETGRIELATGGDHRMDFVYVDDFVKGVLLLLDATKPLHQVYNISSGKAYSIKEVAVMLGKIIPNVEIVIGDGLMDMDPRRGIKIQQKGALDSTRAKNDLGFQISYELQDGLERYVEYLKINAF
jgi:UDP-glucose 4-epimerase